MFDRPLRLIAFGAHPDDCEIFCGGLAVKYTAMGHAVKFVSVTNGNAGHHLESRNNLAKQRKKEAKKAAGILGIDFAVLEYDDGELLPSLEARLEITQLIRKWRADIVITHRPNDYHPDHRYTSILVQDSAYMVAVPLIAPDTPALKYNPYFFYFWDHFQKPYPFQPDVAISVDRDMKKKWDMMHCHTSQFYEWLPYMEGDLDHVPEKVEDRREWLELTWGPWLKQMTKCGHERLRLRYGDNNAASIEYAEAYEISEYGQQPTLDVLERLFPK